MKRCSGFKVPSGNKGRCWVNFNYFKQNSWNFLLFPVVLWWEILCPSSLGSREGLFKLRFIWSNILRQKNWVSVRGGEGKRGDLELGWVGRNCSSFANGSKEKWRHWNYLQYYVQWQKRNQANSQFDLIYLWESSLTWSWDQRALFAAVSPDKKTKTKNMRKKFRVKKHATGRNLWNLHLFQEIMN